MSPINEIVANSWWLKESIWLIITWFAWSITHILNKTRKGEVMTLRQHISHIVISWFVWYLLYLWCQYFDITWPMQWIIIWIGSYSWIQIVEALEMMKAQTIFNLVLDFLNFKTWKAVNTQKKQK